MNKKGSSLVELVAVLVILGIITAIAVPTTGALINRTKKKACIASMDNLEVSCKYLLHQEYENFIGLEEQIKETFVNSGGIMVNNNEYSGICSKDGNYIYEITSEGNLKIHCTEHEDVSKEIIASDERELGAYSFKMYVTKESFFNYNKENEC